MLVVLPMVTIRRTSQVLKFNDCIVRRQFWDEVIVVPFCSRLSDEALTQDSRRAQSSGRAKGQCGRRPPHSRSGFHPSRSICLKILYRVRSCLHAFGDFHRLDGNRRQ